MNKKLIALALAGTFAFAGCGNNAETKEAEPTTDTTVTEPAVDEATDAKEAEDKADEAENKAEEAADEAKEAEENADEAATEAEEEATEKTGN